MLGGAFRKTAFLLTSSTVILNSKETANNVSENTFLDKIRQYFNGEQSEANSSNVRRDVKDLSGWDRLTVMYTRDEFGYLSKELNAVLYCTYTSVFAGGLYGTIINTKQAFQEFMERNQATQFANMFEARKKMQDKVIIAGMKGAFKYGAQVGLFTGGVLCCSLSLMVYYNRKSVLFYGVSAGALGAIHRWRMGPKGMFVGGLCGTLLGLFGGGLTNGMFYITGQNLDDVLTFQASQIEKRDQVVDNILKEDKDSRNEYLPLLQKHETIVEVEKEQENEIVPVQNINVKK